MNEEFEFKIYSKKHNHSFYYKLVRIKEGWYFKHEVITLQGKCDPEGHPYLINSFKQDNISYPDRLPFMIGCISRHAEDLTKEQIQEKINELAEWASNCEKTKPSWEPYY